MIPNSLLFETFLTMCLGSPGFLSFSATWLASFVIVALCHEGELDLSLFKKCCCNSLGVHGSLAPRV